MYQDVNFNILKYVNGKKVPKYAVRRDCGIDVV